jgi:acyl carrier protein
VEVEMTKQAIRKIWSEELKLGDIGDDDDFFTVGGHSLIMAKIQARIKRELGIAIPMDQLFRHSSINALSASIDQRSGQPGSAPVAVTA